MTALGLTAKKSYAAIECEMDENANYYCPNDGEKFMWRGFCYCTEDGETAEEAREALEQDFLDDISGESTVECGSRFIPDSGTTCDCPSEVFFANLDGQDVYCCGWVVDNECATEYVYSVCRQIANDDLRSKCEDCAGNEVAGVWTAVGCIPTDHTSIIQVFIKLGLLTGGGMALLIILAGSFMLSVSQGDPKKTSEAKEMITSAIIGLIFIIFSVSILQLIGVQILHIPGFAD
jgi:hypothetical protein